MRGGAIPGSTSRLKQLVSMGLGTISGDITEINLDDPTRTVVMELEANNFEDKDGNPLALRALDNEGFVEEAGRRRPWRTSSSRSSSAWAPSRASSPR